MDTTAFQWVVLSILVAGLGWALWVMRKRLQTMSERVELSRRGEEEARRDLAGAQARCEAAGARSSDLDLTVRRLADELDAARRSAEEAREHAGAALREEREERGRIEQLLEGQKAELAARTREIEEHAKVRQELRQQLETQEVTERALLAKGGKVQEEHARALQRIEELEKREGELRAARGRIEELHADGKAAAERIKELETGLAEQAKATEEKLAMQQQLHARQKEEFEGIAAKVLEQNTQKFAGTAGEQLGEVTAEVSKLMADLKKKVEEVHGTDVRDRVALKTELAKMVEASKRLDTEAHNLTRALTRDRRAQGAWGELTLETILEQCGLREGHEYEKQGTYTNDDDRSMRPDVIVHLPGDRAVVVDSKVSLTAYTEYVSSESDEDAAEAMARHLLSVRNHVKGLANKDYWKLNGLRTGDYVLMFLPIESAFADAVRNDGSLFEAAFKQGVIITSPATLLATLRTIEHTWRVERQNETARAIVAQAGKLYDKFVGFAEDLKRVGDRLRQAQVTYDGAMSKLSTGRGNLVRQAEKLRELGVKSSKQLPAELVEAELADAETGGEVAKALPGTGAVNGTDWLEGDAP